MISIKIIAINLLILGLVSCSNILKVESDRLIIKIQDKYVKGVSEYGDYL